VFFLFTSMKYKIYPQRHVTVEHTESVMSHFFGHSGVIRFAPSAAACTFVLYLHVSE